MASSEKKQKAKLIASITESLKELDAENLDAIRVITEAMAGGGEDADADPEDSENSEGSGSDGAESSDGSDGNEDSDNVESSYGED